MLKPGDTIGILGAGQLGRMLALAAAPMGLKTVFYAPETNSPGFDVVGRHICAPYEDYEALSRFIEYVDVITYEFENIPLPTVQFIASRCALYPNANALKISQDRLFEKTFLSERGIPVAPFFEVSSVNDLTTGCEKLGLPSVLKTRRFGYDGKGQHIIKTVEDIKGALILIDHSPCILESFIPFQKEVSIICARSHNGQMEVFDACLNAHKSHILDTTTLPSGLARQTEQQAKDIARTIAEALNYIGVLTVELFVVMKDGEEQLIVNEIAPRVHNSGHWTIEGAQTSQFEQHIRAIAHWPLGSTKRLGDISMQNLVGSDFDQWLSFLQTPDTHLHLYGKTDVRDGRKMGHVTQVFFDQNVS